MFPKENLLESSTQL